MPKIQTQPVVVMDAEMQSCAEYVNTFLGTPARIVRSENKIAVATVEAGEHYSVVFTEGELKYETTESWSAYHELAQGRMEVFLS